MERGLCLHCLHYSAITIHTKNNTSLSVGIVCHKFSLVINTSSCCHASIQWERGDIRFQAAGWRERERERERVRERERTGKTRHIRCDLMYILASLLYALRPSSHSKRKYSPKKEVEERRLSPDQLQLPAHNTQRGGTYTKHRESTLLLLSVLLSWLNRGRRYMS